jgi:hypothetical protein
MKQILANQLGCMSVRIVASGEKSNTFGPRGMLIDTPEESERRRVSFPQACRL